MTTFTLLFLQGLAWSGEAHLLRNLFVFICVHTDVCVCGLVHAGALELEFQAVVSCSSSRVAGTRCCACFCMWGPGI